MKKCNWDKVNTYLCYLLNTWSWKKCVRNYNNDLVEVCRWYIFDFGAWRKHHWKPFMDQMDMFHPAIKFKAEGDRS